MKAILVSRQTGLALAGMLLVATTVTAGTWTGNGPAGAEIGSLALDPHDPNTVYAGAAGQGVFRSTDGGASWLPSSAGLGGARVSTLAVATTGALYVGTTSNGVFKSTNRAATWVSANAGLTNLEVTSMTISPAAPDTVCVGTRGGVFKSTDGGSMWISSGLSTTGIFAIAADPANALVAYASAGYAGFYKSTDGGLSWVATGPPDAYVLRIAVDTVSPSNVYVVAGTGLIFKSTDRGATWTRILEEDQGISSLAVDPSVPTRLYAGSGPFESIFRSDDGGATWTVFDTGLPDGVHVSAIVIAPTGGRVYAGTSWGIFGGAGVFRYDASASCTADSTSLCLNAGRFRVQATWRAQNIGMSGTGQAVPFTSDTGYFWFFSGNNVELVVKVVDGRAFNNKLWVFYGALSNVEYTITVTDTQTGAVKTYFNPQGQLASVADTAAF